MYGKDLNETKYQFLIKKRENIEIKHLNDPKAFIEYSQSENIDYTKLVYIGSGKQHHYNFTIFLLLGTFAENIYNGNLSLKIPKIKQRNMEDMIRKSKNRKLHDTRSKYTS